MTTLKLQEPIEFGSESITELTLRKPVMGDMRKLPAVPEMGDLLDLAGSLCGQPDSVMNKLGVADGMAVMEVVGGFLAPSQTTGGK